MNIDDMLAFAKAKGFFWQSAEIYGGAAGLFDYGHLGSMLRRRFEALWLSYFVDSGKEYYLIDGSTMLPEKPLIASGHTSRFNDILVGCSKCHTYYRADALLAENNVIVSEGAAPSEIDTAVHDNGVRCPKDKGALLPSKPFNMMIDVHLGPERSDKGYLRPETAQSAYLNFFREFNVLRKALPMGLAVIGRAYRNEISPRQGLYRMREFNQAELQIFFNPENWNTNLKEFESMKIPVVLYKTKKHEMLTPKELLGHGIPEFYVYHMGLIYNFYTHELNIPVDKIKFLEKGGDEKAFYNKLHMDIEVDVESWNGFKEVGGLHYRGDYDLSCHSKGSNQDMSVNIAGKKVMPHVLELSFGVDRNIWMLLDIFYRKDGERSVLSLPGVLAPYQLAVFPLQKDERINKKTDEIFKTLKSRYKVAVDAAGSIGRRYARMDEIGTPFCITVDYDTVEEKSDNFDTVTIRFRDDKKQIRKSTKDLQSFFDDEFG